MLSQAHRCGVCGWQGPEDVCPRCGTVLLKGRAFCRRCGKVFEGPAALCDACGGSVQAPPTPSEAEAIERLSRLPGVDAETARKLHARGFHDPMDLLKLALPARAVEQGLHRSIARRLTLEELRPAPRMRKTLECPACGAVHEANENRCPLCGSPRDIEPSADEVKRTLEDVAGEVYDLAADPDFRGLPPEMKEDLLATLEEVGLTASVESEYVDQFREWRGRGIDTSEVERILREEGSEAFRAKFVALVRAQVLKNREGERFLCPLCDVALKPAVDVCENCGAKFR